MTGAGEGRRTTAALLAASGALFVSFGFARVRAGDLFWHLANGRLAMETGRVPLVDVFSFDPAGRPWVQHEWLSGLLLAAWERAFGLETLVFWKWAVVATTFTLLLDACRRLGGSPLAALTGTALAAASAQPFLDLRPHILGLLGAALVLHRAGTPTRLPAWLPLVLLAWVNLHASFVFGLVALAVLSVPALLGADAPLRRRALAVLGCSTAAVAANPHGVLAFVYPLGYALDRASPWRQVSEWRSPFAPGGLEAPLFPLAAAAFVAAAVVVGATRRPGGDRTLLALLALGGLSLAMALASRRFIPLFAVCAAPAVATALAAWRPVRRVEAAAGPWLVPAAALAAAVAALAGRPIGPRAFSPLVALETFPAEATSALERRAPRADVFADYTWGGYLHWRGKGRYRVFVDGRADAVYGEETLRRYLRVARLGPGWEAVVEGSGAGYFLWPSRSPHPDLLARRPGWSVVHSDPVATLLERRPPGGTP